MAGCSLPVLLLRVNYRTSPVPIPQSLYFSVVSMGLPSLVTDVGGASRQVVEGCAERVCNRWVNGEPASLREAGSR